MKRFFRSYEQAIEFLFARINYERLTESAYSTGDLKLDRMRRLLALLGRPQERLRVIHVAGTKGKGSTAVMVSEMLSAAGYKTGLFTSPHLAAFEERIQVDGASPTPEHFIDLVNRLVEPVARMDRPSKGRGPTYFELATALGWLYFLDRGAEIAVLEVGLGGRLDATNVCRPLVGVITNISRDHTHVLGSSVAEIAREKAGIAKRGIPLLSGVAEGPAGDAVEAVCRITKSPLYRLGREIEWRASAACHNEGSRLGAVAGGGRFSIDVDTPWGRWQRLPVPLLGLHQGANAALAVAAVGLLGQQGMPVDSETMAAGLSTVRWPARIEVIGSQPTVVVDAAHNWASTEALVRTLESQFSPRRRILVFAATRGKDVSGMLRLLLPRFDSVVLTQYQTNPRGVPVGELAALVQSAADLPCHVASDASSAWRLARHVAGPDDVICVTGSLFIAAELREIILDGQAPSRRHAIRLTAQ